ncbi:FxDxF family PEP-CTERM protein [Paucibacter sp. Y2R2-4]|uniref:FxDxF family PEP-CTERM protein n=1 Tax=Paucibacter sp. Y2R2-4 TaxID=2893553 RepID=UPI0021E4088D|nr:FxDxF family PEP-CTERM protein [Paucibacter sp. Y2R2-4]MCV2349360.1 FxDxF family PEP-CTERM protein [Paucibacter sp. Y2R2-4]
MNKLKTTVMGLGAVAVLAAMSSAVAGPVKFQSGGQFVESVGDDRAIKNEEFSDSYKFHLIAAQVISGTLQTQGQQKGERFLDPLLDIRNVYFSNEQGAKVFLTPVAGTELAGSRTKGVEQWAVAPGQKLEAGDWTLNIEGKGGIAANKKDADRYIVRLDGVNAVPEPQSLALSLLGLGAVLYVRRGRRV